jgi:predicted TIM-barrel enzyme
VAALAAADVEARGKVGDADIVQAVEDTLASFPATDVVLVTGSRESDQAGMRAAEELRRRLDRPLRHLEV